MPTPAGKTANPYQSNLFGRDYREVMVETPDRLTHVVDLLGPEGLERSFAPGKWSAAVIVAHLADCEIAFAFRLRQALAEPHHMIQPFDQDAWSTVYSSMRIDGALDVFRAVRKWNLVLTGALAADAFTKPVSHPERGEMTFQVLLETIAGHDLNHLKQLETIVSQSN